MKCPKCGSELNEVFLTPYISEMICLNKKCEKFGYAVDLEYQQRLDKVLEKFTPSEEDVLYYNLIDDVENSMVNITYTTTIKTFYIELFNNHNDDKIETNEISLAIVEHLIVDMEAQDE